VRGFFSIGSMQNPDDAHGVSTIRSGSPGAPKHRPRCPSWSLTLVAGADITLMRPCLQSMPVAAGRWCFAADC